MTKFAMVRDINGYNSYVLPFSDLKYSAVLSVGVVQSLTIPNEGNYLCVFSIEPGANVWIANNATAAVPAGAMATSTSQLNPVAATVAAGDVLSFVSENVDASVGIALYAL